MLRAVNFSAWQPETHATTLLRERTIKGARQIFAALGSRYRTDCDTDALARVIATAPRAQGAKGEFLYDGHRAQIKAIYHSDIKPDSAVAGEIFKATVIVDTADDGSQGIKVRAGVIRNLCRNLIILDESEQSETTAHVGEDLAQSVSDMIARAFVKIEAFGSAWGNATKERILDEAANVYDVETVFKKLWDAELIGVTGDLDEAAQIGRFVRAWKKEPGYTRADIVNAITRAAHEEAWGNPWDCTDLEEQGGQLLYNRVCFA